MQFLRSFILKSPQRETMENVHGEIVASSLKKELSDSEDGKHLSFQELWENERIQAFSVNKSNTIVKHFQQRIELLHMLFLTRPRAFKRETSRVLMEGEEDINAEFTRESEVYYSTKLSEKKNNLFNIVAEKSNLSRFQKILRQWLENEEVNKFKNIQEEVIADKKKDLEEIGSRGIDYMNEFDRVLESKRPYFLRALPTPMKLTFILAMAVAGFILGNVFNGAFAVGIGLLGFTLAIILVSGKSPPPFRDVEQIIYDRFQCLGILTGLRMENQFLKETEKYVQSTLMKVENAITEIENAVLNLDTQSKDTQFSVTICPDSYVEKVRSISRSYLKTISFSKKILENGNRDFNHVIQEMLSLPKEIELRFPDMASLLSRYWNTSKTGVIDRIINKAKNLLSSNGYKIKSKMCFVIAPKNIFNFLKRLENRSGLIGFTVIEGEEEAENNITLIALGEGKKYEKN